MAGELSKREARARGRSERAKLPAAERAAGEREILRLCQKELDWHSYRRAHLFLPIERLGEINTWPLVEWIWHEHPQIRVYLPRVAGRQLEHVRVMMGTELRVSRAGVTEPIEGEELRADELLDIIFVPLLAADRQGHRVGYGAGHYDRFLDAHPEARKLGVARESWIVPEGIVTEEHDVPLDGLVTEQGLKWFD